MPNSCFKSEALLYRGEKVSGKTAGEWIDEYVILEAKALLKYSVMSIQEVAYYMNFPNPSFSENILSITPECHQVNIKCNSRRRKR